MADKTAARSADVKASMKAATAVVWREVMRAPVMAVERVARMAVAKAVSLAV